MFCLGLLFLFIYFYIYLFVYFETFSNYRTLPGLELAKVDQLALNSVHRPASAPRHVLPYLVYLVFLEFSKLAESYIICVFVLKMRDLRVVFHKPFTDSVLTVDDIQLTPSFQKFCPGMLESCFSNPTHA